jgi:hypothetical protein
MTDEQTQRACGYKVIPLWVIDSHTCTCRNCWRAMKGSEDVYCAEHNGMPVSLLGVCRDWKAREEQANEVKL